MMILKECYPTYKMEYWDYEKNVWNNLRSFYDYGHAVQWYKCYHKEHPTLTIRLIKVFYYHEFDEDLD